MFTVQGTNSRTQLIGHYSYVSRKYARYWVLLDTESDLEYMKSTSKVDMTRGHAVEIDRVTAYH